MGDGVGGGEDLRDHTCQQLQQQQQQYQQISHPLQLMQQDSASSREGRRNSALPRLQSITGSSVLSGSAGSSGGVLDSGGQDDVEGEGCGSTTATAGSSTSSNEGVVGGGRHSDSRRRKSRITYDREQGVRYYRGTATTDSNDCDCEDI